MSYPDSDAQELSAELFRVSFRRCGAGGRGCRDQPGRPRPDGCASAARRRPSARSTPPARRRSGSSPLGPFAGAPHTRARKALRDECGHLGHAVRRRSDGHATRHWANLGKSMSSQERDPQNISLVDSWPFRAWRSGRHLQPKPQRSLKRAIRFIRRGLEARQTEHPSPEVSHPQPSATPSASRRGHAWGQGPRAPT